MSQQRIDPQELIAMLNRLEDRVEDLEAENERLREQLAEATETNTSRWAALREDIQSAEKRLHGRVNRVEQRVTTVEDAVGVETPDEALTPLGLLERVGPEAIAEGDPGATLRRARTILVNREDWGETRTTPKYGTHRYLSTREHPLKELLGEARGEHLEWVQIHRAMAKLVAVADRSDEPVVLDEEYRAGEDAAPAKAVVFAGGWR